MKPIDYKWKVLWVIMIGTFMASLDSSIVNISIPTMMRYFKSTVVEIEWVITAYMIAFAVVMPLTPWLKDIIGLKSLYILSLFLFTLGSLLCGIAPNLPILIFARILQALGGGALTPTAMSIVSKIFDSEHRGGALGYWGLGVVLGSAVGPSLGGFLTEVFGWRSIFLVNIPVGILGIYFSVKVINQKLLGKGYKRPLDYMGFIFLSFFLVLFLYSISLFEKIHELDLNHTVFLGKYILGVFILFALFIRRELKARFPLINLKIFKNLVFSVCVLITISRSIALVGGVFMLPILLQEILGYSELESGLIMLPGALVISLLMPISGRWSDRHGVRGVSFIGLIIVAVSMFLFSETTLESSGYYIFSVLMIRGIGLGLLVTPIAAATINSVAPSQVTLASSISSLMQQIGGALGVAIMATLYQIHLNNPNFKQSLSPVYHELISARFTFAISCAIILLTLIPARYLPTKTRPMSKL